MEILDYKTVREDRFSRIEFPSPLYKLHRKKRGLSLGEDKNITSWDLEVLTFQGKTIPVMMGYCSVDSDNKVIRKDTGLIDRVNVCKDILRHKTERRPHLWKQGVYRGDREIILQSFLKEMIKGKYVDNINFFYNISYDMGVLLSCLPDEKITELDATNETEYIFDGIKIKIITIPKKMLILKRGRQSTAFYDLASMTKQSLENACTSWLGEGKMKLPFNLAVVMNSLEQFIPVYDSGKLQKYCLKDCERTSRLGYAVRKHFNGYNVPFSRPCSPASLSKDYITFNNLHFPKYTYYSMQRDCYQGYYGGLFEFYQRGYFKNAKGYDVDSLYPSVMTELPSLEDCSVMYSREIDPKADWAVITARVWLDPAGVIMPFNARAKVRYYNEQGRKKLSEKMLRPVFNGQKTIMTLQLYKFLTSGKYPHIKNIEIEYCYNIYENKECRRPFAYLKDLFNTRLNLINEFGKGDKRQEVLKIILNSGYGATAEVIGKPKYTKENGVIFTQGKNWDPGAMFRPFQAFHITELSRLKMFENIFNAGVEENVIAIATDCIYITEEGQNRFERLADVTPDKELGTFSIDYQGDMLAIGNGVYFFDNGERTKKTTRGFNERKMPNLFYCLNCENKCYQGKKKIKVFNTRPLGFKEVMHFHRGQKELIGVFREEVKELDINMDRSRTWQKEVNDIYELSQGIIKSKPLELPVESYWFLTDNSKFYYNKGDKEGNLIKEDNLIMEDQYRDFENFKNTMILLDQDNEFMKNKYKTPKYWITWKGKKVLIFNEAIWQGEVPPEWQGFEFKDLPWIKTSDRENMREIIMYLIKEREEFLLIHLEVLAEELNQGQNPFSYRYEDTEGFMQYRRVKSGNPLWFREPSKVYNWYSLSSSLSKDRIYSAVENKNPRSQLYHDLRFLSHKILSEGDPEHDYPADPKYQDIINALQELISEIKKEGRELINA